MGNHITKLVTIRDVATHAGVSLATASRVLTGTGYSSQEAREKVLHSAQELGYTPNQLARNLKRMKTDTIGLMITDIVNPFYSVLADAVLNTAQELGYHVILCATNEDEQLENDYLRVLMNQRAIAVIAVPTGHNLGSWKELLAMGMKLVLLDRELPELPAADVVMVDNMQGAQRAVAYLASLGHRRIGIINGPVSTTTGAGRLNGYLAALEEANLPIDDNLIAIGSFKRDAAVEATRKLLAVDDPPTAIFAGNNQLGEVCYSVLRDAGLSIPDDISLVFFDDVTWASLVNPPITVVSQPTFEMGQLGMRLIYERLRTAAGSTQQPPHRVVLEPGLIVRSSCSPPAPR